MVIEEGQSLWSEEVLKNTRLDSIRKEFENIGNNISNKLAQ